MTTDTSTEAVEALSRMARVCIGYGTCKKDCGEAGMCIARLRLIESVIASARRTALEDAAKMADHHINGAAVAKNIRALIEEEQK